ncbi:hypothetical protein AOLI_G00025840 [Acnodon oligacanthus]
MAAKVCRLLLSRSGVRQPLPSPPHTDISHTPARSFSSVRAEQVSDTGPVLEAGEGQPAALSVRNNLESNSALSTSP